MWRHAILPLSRLCVLVALVSPGLAPPACRAQQSDLHPDAVALWDFDANGDGRLRDASGNGHHGRIVGATWVSGSWGRALRFERSQRQYVTIPDSPALHIQPPYTLGVWFRTTSSRNNAVYLIKNGGTFTGCGLYYYGDSQSMYVDAKGTDQKLYHNGNSARHLPDGRWHHALAICGEGKQILYLDGQVFTERTVPADLTLDYSGTQGVQLGVWPGNGHFDGLMGRAYILKTALNATQVRTLYDTERRAFSPALTVRPAATAPQIDGRFEDACWTDQVVLEHFHGNDYDTRPAAHASRVQLSYDAQHLFLAARCQRPSGAPAATPLRARDDSASLADNRLEVFLSPQPGTYYHLVVTAANGQLDQKCTYVIERSGYAPGGFAEFSSDRSWDCPGLRTAVRRDDEADWFEMAIPLSALGAHSPDARWRLNVVRGLSDARLASSFSPIFGGFHRPDQFSELTFATDHAVVTRSAKPFTSVDVTPGAVDRPDDDADDRGLVFTSNYLERGSYTTLPGKRQRDTIEMFAAQGEYEPFTVSVRAQQTALPQVRVAIAGDLANARGDSIRADRVSIRSVELWRRQINSRQHMYMERFLERPAVVDIPRHTTRRFWVTVYVPPRTPPGVYRSQVRVTAGGRQLASLPLQVEVLPIELRQAPGMGYFMYLPTWGIAPQLRTASYLKRIFVDMREHGMTTATLYPYGLPFAAVMDALRDSGLMRADVPAIWLGADAVGPDTWDRVLDEARVRKWPELALYLQDEPGNQQRIDNAKRLFGILDQFRKDYPEHRTVRSTTAIGETGIKALGSQYDIWIAGAGFGRELVEQARDGEKLLWSYDCNLAPVDAESCRYYFGWYCWKAGIKGSALWAYSDPGSTASDAWDPVFRDVSGTELHYCFVRPTADDLVPTIGWEAVREGVDDHRYVATLQEAIRRARKAGKTTAADRAQKVLDGLADQIDVRGYRNGIAGGDAAGHRLGNHYDRTAPQKNIGKPDYNRLRRRLADALLDLQRRL